MHELSTANTTLIVIAVLLFFFLGIAIMVIMDHKAKLPGGFTANPFSVVGMRADHPAIALHRTPLQGPDEPPPAQHAHPVHRLHDLPRGRPQAAGVDPGVALAELLG